MATARLICFAYAGAGPTAFACWPALAPDHLEILAYAPPGREIRADEPALTSWSALVADAARAFGDAPPGDYAIYGHSMGALLALDAACAYVGRRPTHVYLAARAFPRTRLDRYARAAQLDDPSLASALAGEFGAPPPSTADESVAAISLQRLRVDLAALGDRPPGVGRRNAPITAIAGVDDPSTTEEAKAPWAEAAGDGRFRNVEIPGGHYPDRVLARAVLGLVAADLGVRD